MFGLGIPEILFILLLAIIILGPEHMPKAAEMLGRWSSKVRSAATSLSEAVSRDEDLREIHHSMNTVRSELSTAKHELLKPVTETRGAILEPVSEVHDSVREAREALRHIPALASETAGGEAVDVDGVMGPGGVPAGESDFMHKPVRWFSEDSGDGDAGEEKKARETCCAYRLASPRLLPSDISRMVMRKRMALKPVSSMEFGHLGITLSAPVPGRAFCRRMAFFPVRQHGVHRAIVLSCPNPLRGEGEIREDEDSHA